MRGSEKIIVREERVLAWRLFLKYIQRSAGDDAGLQGVRQCFRIDQLPSRAIHDTNPVLHRGESSRVQHVVGFWGEGDMQSNEIALPIKLRQRNKLDFERRGALRANVRIVRDDLHLKRLGTFDHLAANTTKPDDAQRLSAKFVAEKLLLFPFATFG